MHGFHPCLIATWTCRLRPAAAVMDAHALQPPQAPAPPLMLLPQQPSLNQPSLPKLLGGKGRDCRDGCCFFLELSLLGLGLGRLSEGKRRYKC
ncbi:hypothetical protein ACFX14_027437 [Malus domestica]